MNTVTRILLIVAIAALAETGIYLFTGYRRSLTQKDACGNPISASSDPRFFEPCTTISGTVRLVMRRPNGTAEVWLRPDSSYTQDVNEGNVTGQAGNLLVVLSCAKSSAALNMASFNACDQFTKTAILPQVNDRLSFTGPILVDQKWGWNEMYPVSESRQVTD